VVCFPVVRGGWGCLEEREEFLSCIQTAWKIVYSGIEISGW